MYPFERRTPLANAPHLHARGARHGGGDGAAVGEVDLRGYDIRNTFTVDVSRKVCLRRLRYPRAESQRNIEFHSSRLNTQQDSAAHNM